MNVQTIQEPGYQASMKYREYLKAVKVAHSRYVDDLRKGYLEMSRGRAIVDIYAAFKQAGTNQQGDPKLAIAPADFQRVGFKKQDLGAGEFSFWQGRGRKFELLLPTGTFAAWANDDRTYAMSRRDISTRVPIVPPAHLPEQPLAKFHILWEVENWDAVPADPILLKRINKNLFVVMAAWDLTPLEQALVNGRPVN